MNKKAVSLLAVLMFMLPMASCANKNDSPSDGEVKNSITVQHLDLGEGFNSEYYPVSTEVEQRSGQIDVVLEFEGTNKAWEAVADEYMRLHSDAVTVNIGVEGIESNYRDRLNTELTSGNTEWDIVQGNLITDVSSKCINMSGALTKKNAYAGNVTWRKVLTESAYKTDSTGSSSAYIMNSQYLQTAWFINTVAFNAAQTEAAKDGVILKQNPGTWDELILICKYMKQAGYTNPLGISLQDDSINGYQFSWLLRVYGDYYYRNEYDNIMWDDTYKVDVTSENPEADLKYSVQPTKFFNVILDDSETNERYVGAKSGKYKEFVNQFVKMKDYLSASTATSFDDMRNKFKTQSDGKSSPQIMLDYAGSGLSFNSTDGFQVDFFDYPYMVSEGGYIKENTLMRDVGGNGGYLSIVNHNTKQNDLNLDFIKFVMSPYGQSIYYNALSKTDVAPQGITTVKNDLVLVPDEWAQFFKTDKISFTGLSDSDEFVKSFMRSIGSYQGNIDTSIVIWRDVLKGSITTDQFADKWHKSLLDGWNDYHSKINCSYDSYKTWGGPEN